MPLRLITLGVPLELLKEDGTPIKLPNSKHLALLAYLTLEPGAYPREWLTRFIWSSGEAGSMNDALSALRGVFGPEVFPPRQKEVALEPHLLSCDALEFAQRAAADEELRIDSLLERYRGPFLTDFNPRGASTRFIKWVERKRTDLETLFLDRLKQACERAAQEGDWQTISRLVEQALKRVSAWPEAEHWRTLAGELREASRPPALMAPASGVAATPAPSPPPASAAIPAASTAQTATDAPSRRRRRAPALAFLLLAAALIGAGGLWIWRTATPPSRAEGGGAAPAGGTLANAAAPLCAPGKAAGQLVDEVFFYGTRVRPGRPFRKAWIVQNTGGCTWGTDFRLHFVSSSDERLSRTMMDIPLESPLPPGARDTFEVPMQAPGVPGEYGEMWQMRDGGDQPVRMGDTYFLRAGIKVPLPHYPACVPGEGTGLLLLRKFPPGTVLRPGERFRYSWTIKNTAECAWSPGTTMRFRSHTQGRLSRTGAVVPTRTVEPDETYTFLVPMQAPRRSGVYQEVWELEGPGGTPIRIGSRPTISMQIQVADAETRTSPTAALCGPGEAQIRFYDENWRDSTRVRPGQTFTKRWTVLNNGPCTWDADFVLHYSHHEGAQLAISRADKPVGERVPPETAYTFEVPMRVPAHRGYIRENWRFLDDQGRHIKIGTSPYLAAILIVEPE